MTAQLFEMLPMTRSQIAIHEAGHSVIARATGRKTSCTIEATNGWLGLSFDEGLDPSTVGVEEVRREAADRCIAVRAVLPLIGEPRDIAASWFAHARDSVMIYQAGWLAEFISRGPDLPRQPFSSDAINARHYAETVAYCPEAATAFLNYCEVDTTLLLKKFWRSVEAVADALFEHGTLNSEAVDHAIRIGVGRDQRAEELERRERWREFVEECGGRQPPHTK